MATSRIRGISVLLLAALAIGGVAPARAIEFGCRIGKPSYCFKYGQMFCLERNSIEQGREKACEDWTAACLVCHARIPDCLGGTRPPTSSPQCKACEDEWHACMHAIDAVYWPNRRQPRADQ